MIKTIENLIFKDFCSHKVGLFSSVKNVTREKILLSVSLIRGMFCP
jgi:hypothetical protein